LRIGNLLDEHRQRLGQLDAGLEHRGQLPGELDDLALAALAKHPGKPANLLNTGYFLYPRGMQTLGAKVFPRCVRTFSGDGTFDRLFPVINSSITETGHFAFLYCRFCILYLQIYVLLVFFCRSL